MILYDPGGAPSSSSSHAATTACWITAPSSYTVYKRTQISCYYQADSYLLSIHLTVRVFLTIIPHFLCSLSRCFYVVVTLDVNTGFSSFTGRYNIANLYAPLLCLSVISQATRKIQSDVDNRQNSLVLMLL